MALAVQSRSGRSLWKFCRLLTASECSAQRTTDSFTPAMAVSHFHTSITNDRWFSRWDAQWRIQMHRRRKKIGPEPEKHRNIWPNWNLDAEFFAFGQRLGENFSEGNIRLAFIHPSFAKQLVEERKQLGVETPDTELNTLHHGELRDKGKSVVETYLPAFIRFNFPYLPEEGVFAVTKDLCRLGQLATISRHLGTHDMIKCAEFPCSDLTLRDTLLAVIGALSVDSGMERAGHFVLDFLFAPLSEKDTNIIYDPLNPMGLLAELLAREGRQAPEPRLIGQTGQADFMSTFNVGIYCNKQLIGQGFGETILTAEEIAAKNALHRLFGTQLGRRPLVLGDAGKRVDYNNFLSVPNVPLSKWTRKACEERLKERIGSRLASESDVSKQRTAL